MLTGLEAFRQNRVSGGPGSPWPSSCGGELAWHCAAHNCSFPALSSPASHAGTRMESTHLAARRCTLVCAPTHAHTRTCAPPLAPTLVQDKFEATLEATKKSLAASELEASSLRAANATLTEEVEVLREKEVGVGGCEAIGCAWWAVCWQSMGDVVSIVSNSTQNQFEVGGLWTEAQQAFTLNACQQASIALGQPCWLSKGVCAVTGPQATCAACWGCARNKKFIHPCSEWVERMGGAGTT